MYRIIVDDKKGFRLPLIVADCVQVQEFIDFVSTFAEVDVKFEIEAIKETEG